MSSELPSCSLAPKPCPPHLGSCHLGASLLSPHPTFEPSPSPTTLSLLERSWVLPSVTRFQACRRGWAAPPSGEADCHRADQGQGPGWKTSECEEGGRTESCPLCPRPPFTYTQGDRWMSPGHQGMDGCRTSPRWPHADHVPYCCSAPFDRIAEINFSIDADEDSVSPQLHAH